MEKKETLMNFWKQYFEFSDDEIRAFGEIKREDFVPDELKFMAYEDVPLPLMRGKTISQPTTVMIMTSALNAESGHKVLELGTGSGYQAAILAKLVGPKGQVITTEVIPELVDFAKKNLKRAGIHNVRIYEEDSSKGIPEHAPFDRIIITAAGKEFPSPLVEQLRPEGIIIGPLGDKDAQEMVKGTKKEDGTLDLEFLGPFMFTPMYGKYGFEI
jgi:protein-L-isoaspartate(D-aspartate) O-methyltransferase